MEKAMIVTGGNGFIGSHMSKLLSSKGHKVVVLDDFSSSPKGPVHQYGEFVVGDIADKNLLTSIFKKYDVECLFHFAAKALVPEGEENPFLYYRENLVKTLSLLEATQTLGLKKFIFSSTCATFGIPQTSQLNESHPQNPINTYGNTKKLMEFAMRDLARKQMMNFVVFRYFNAAGCSPDGEIGENHEPETHLIPNLCKAYFDKKAGNFKMYGNEMPTRDGSCIRDYVHVEDLVQAHYDGLVYLNKNSGFHDFNLGTETGSSVKEVIKAFEEVTGEKMKVEIHPPRPGDPPALVSDSAKAKALLNFKPKYSLNDSINHTLNYLKKKYV